MFRMLLPRMLGNFDSVIAKFVVLRVRSSRFSPLGGSAFFINSRLKVPRQRLFSALAKKAVWTAVGWKINALVNKRLAGELLVADFYWVAALWWGNRRFCSVVLYRCVCWIVLKPMDVHGYANLKSTLVDKNYGCPRLWLFVERFWGDKFEKIGEHCRHFMAVIFEIWVVGEWSDSDLPWTSPSCLTICFYSPICGDNSGRVKVWMFVFYSGCLAIDLAGVKSDTKHAWFVPKIHRDWAKCVQKTFVNLPRYLR